MASASQDDGTIKDDNSEALWVLEANDAPKINNSTESYAMKDANVILKVFSIQRVSVFMTSNHKSDEEKKETSRVKGMRSLDWYQQLLKKAMIARYDTHELK